MAFSDQIKTIQEQMQGFDVSELSFENIGSWPIFIKLIAWVAIFTAIIFGGYKFIVSDMQVTQAAAVNKEAELKKQFENKAFQAANLDAYRKQMKEMEESFGALISQLPSDTEVPGLLEDISNRGASSGLAFNAITLQAEVTKEFYIELPIKIQATGTYHDMGAFVSGVASLPRIVTLSNFSIRPQGGKGDSSNLLLDITASTYRYKDDGADSKAKGKAAAKGRKGKKK
jgi:type IV pilus assembly protein PilO